MLKTQTHRSEGDSAAHRDSLHIFIHASTHTIILSTSNDSMKVWITVLSYLFSLYNSTREKMHLNQIFTSPILKTESIYIYTATCGTLSRPSSRRPFGPPSRRSFGALVFRIRALQVALCKAHYCSHFPVLTPCTVARNSGLLYYFWCCH